jgi:hypothetical protein
MTALPARRRAAAPAYYLGRPASFWTTHLSTRRRGPRAAAVAESQDRSPDVIGALGPEALKIVTDVNGVNDGPKLTP